MAQIDELIRAFPTTDEIRKRLLEACKDVRTLKELLKVAERRDRVRQEARHAS